MAQPPGYNHSDFGHCGHDNVNFHRDRECSCIQCNYRRLRRPQEVLNRIRASTFHHEPGRDIHYKVPPTLSQVLTLPNRPNPVDLAQRRQTGEEFIAESRQCGGWREDEEEDHLTVPGDVAGQNAFTLELTQRHVPSYYHLKILEIRNFCER